MRIWSLHPQYLDAKGIVALWRETLLAKHVIEGKTKGYTHHPQLERFQNNDRPLDCLNAYLSVVYNEALQRNYHFDLTKFERVNQIVQLPVTSGQLRYEQQHLLAKLKMRDPERYNQLKDITIFAPHPIFFLIEGETEPWEKIT
jgi:hypothetical protein